MRLRAAGLTVAAAAAVGLAAGAVILPASAGSPRRAPGDAPAAVSPQVLSAMQRDLKLTPDGARARLTNETKAARTESQLRQKLGAQFGGAWLTADAGTLVVGVTSAADV